MGKGEPGHIQRPEQIDRWGDQWSHMDGPMANRYRQIAPVSTQVLVFSKKERRKMRKIRLLKDTDTSAGRTGGSVVGSDDDGRVNYVDRHIASGSGGENKANIRGGSALLESNGSGRECDPKPLSASEKQEQEQTTEHLKNLTEDDSKIDVTHLSVSAPNPVLAPHPPVQTQTSDMVPSSGAAEIPLPPQIALLNVKDVDGKYIDIPVYEPLPWQKLCNFLAEKQVLAKQHLSSGDCIVYTRDGRVLFDQDWDNWIALAVFPSDDSTLPQLQVELRVVRKSCCEKLSERDQDVW